MTPTPAPAALVAPAPRPLPGPAPFPAVARIQHSLAAAHLELAALPDNDQRRSRAAAVLTRHTGELSRVLPEQDYLELATLCRLPGAGTDTAQITLTAVAAWLATYCGQLRVQYIQTHIQHTLRPGATGSPDSAEAFASSAGAARDTAGAATHHHLGYL